MSVVPNYYFLVTIQNWIITFALVFIRIKTSPNSPKKAIQIVESIRRGGKVSQRIVRHVGTAFNEEELKSMRALAEHIKVEMESQKQASMFDNTKLVEMAVTAREKKDSSPLEVDLKKLREDARIVTGIHEVYGKVYDLFGFDKVMSHPSRRKASVSNLRQSVMGRIAHPVSKRATAAMLTEHYGANLSESALYRMMDHIDNNLVDRIQDNAFNIAQSLSTEPIGVMFYDCTTLYFESFTEDELKESGYSKDMKFNQPQVLLSLLVTSQGLPVGYELFPGSTFEGHTLIESVEKLEKRYRLHQLIIVADSGMLNDENLKAMEKAGKHYIVGGRIKNQSNKLKAEVVDKSAYKSLNGDLSVRELTIKKDKKEPEAIERRLVASYSLKREKKDCHDRQKAVDKLMEKASKSSNPKELVSNYGYQKYIKIEGEASYRIDTDKIEADKQWDGLLGVVTNLSKEQVSAQQILEHYHGLWQVEQCFRVSKTDLRVRPIYHWTPRRIKAHIAICFMALACVRYLYHLTKVHQLDYSEMSIRQTLIDVQLSILSHIDNDHRYGIPSKKTTQAEKLYMLMGLKLSDVPFQID